MNNKRTWILFFLLSLVGAALSIWTIYHHVGVRMGSVANSFCNISETINCDKVALSPFAEILGLPLGSYGVVYFGSLAVLALAALYFGSSQYFTSIAFCLSTVGSLNSIILFLISKFLIHSICLVCCGIYAVNFLLFAIIYFNISEPVKTFLDGIKNIVLYPYYALDRPEVKKGKCQTYFLGVQILLFIVAFAIPKYFEKTMHKVDLTKSLVSAKSEIPLNSDQTIGDKNAPVTLTEFSDLQCPACRAYYPTLEKILQKYSGKVKVIFRQFPLDKSCNRLITRDMHPFGCLASEALLCAAVQGKFDKMLSVLTTLPELEIGVEPFTPEQVKSGIMNHASKLNLDITKFENCIDNHEQLGKIKDDIELAFKLDINSTPTLFINDKKLMDLLPQTIESAINSYLK